MRVTRALLRALSIYALIFVIAYLFWVDFKPFRARRPLVGPPNSNAIFSSGGFHCPGDGPYRIHYHDCYGPAYALPKGTKPNDYPDY